MGKVLVCGGRDYIDRKYVFGFLDGWHASVQVTGIVQGGAPGADRLAQEWARFRRIPYVTYKAKWKELGNAAGPMRNQEMLDKERPDLVIAFPGGTGTADMVSRARAGRVPVIRAPSV